MLKFQAYLPIRLKSAEENSADFFALCDFLVAFELSSLLFTYATEQTRLLYLYDSALVLFFLALVSRIGNCGNESCHRNT